MNYFNTILFQTFNVSMHFFFSFRLALICPRMLTQEMVHGSVPGCQKRRCFFLFDRKRQETFYNASLFTIALSRYAKQRPILPNFYCSVCPGGIFMFIHCLNARLLFPLNLWWLLCFYSSNVLSRLMVIFLRYYYNNKFNNHYVLLFGKPHTF